MDISNYKSAIVQYSCIDCFLGNNYVIIFDLNRGKYFESEKGECKHIDLTFHSSFNKNTFNFLIELQCKKCQNKENKKILNKDFNDDIASFQYTCKCGEGNLDIGISLEKEVTNLSDIIEQKPKEKIEKNESKSILNDDLKLYTNKGFEDKNQNIYEFENNSFISNYTGIDNSKKDKKGSYNFELISNIESKSINDNNINNDNKNSLNNYDLGNTNLISNMSDNFFKNFINECNNNKYFNNNNISNNIFNTYNNSNSIYSNEYYIINNNNNSFNKNVDNNNISNQNKINHNFMNNNNNQNNFNNNNPIYFKNINPFEDFQNNQNNMLKKSQKNNSLNNFKDNENRNYISNNNKPNFENNFNNNNNNKNNFGKFQQKFNKFNYEEKII